MRKRKKTGRLWICSGAIALTAMLSMAGIAVVKQGGGQQKEEMQEEQRQTAKTKQEKKTEQENQEQEEEIQKTDQGSEQTAQAEPEEETQNVAAMIEANKAQSQAEEKEETQETQAEPAVEDVVEPQVQQHFSDAATLQWPVEGSVLMNYSMDSTVYFSTLQQYKYNPAMIIAGTVNEKVSAAAAGTVTDISSNEETGCTVTMDLGDGYTAIYGQLKELSCSVGDHLEAGSALGHISEPTKYYSSEGCNLFFELQKDGTPIDPLSFLE